MIPRATCCTATGIVAVSRLAPREGQPAAGAGPLDTAGLGRLQPAGDDPVREIRSTSAFEPPTRPLRAPRHRSQPVDFGRPGRRLPGSTPILEPFAATRVGLDDFRREAIRTAVPTLGLAGALRSNAEPSKRSTRPWRGMPAPVRGGPVQDAPIASVLARRNSRAEAKDASWFGERQEAEHLQMKSQNPESVSPFNVAPLSFSRLFQTR